MISDTLAEAIASIDEYLADPAFGYVGDLRARIVAVRDQMEALREDLDAPPTNLLGIRIIPPRIRPPLPPDSEEEGEL
jgi:hypothetical protein